MVLHEQINKAPERPALDAKSWGRLWKLKIQDRLKLLLWKIAAEALKTKGALARILHCEEEVSFLCPFCHLALEDTIHLLVRCSVAFIMWRESPWAIHMDVLNPESAACLIGLVLNADRVLNVSKGSLNAFALNAAIVMDSLCFLCHKVIHEDARVVSGDLVDSI